MAYLFYTLTFVCVVLLTVLYITRHRWAPLVPSNLLPTQLYHRLPTTFREDVEAGFHSSNFDLASNITGDDQRSGLDAKAKRDVQRIMKRRNVGFDEARRIYMEQAFKKQGISADGTPRDPKFVSFS